MVAKQEVHTQAEVLIAIAEEMVRELHKERHHHPPITLASSLENDLGLDSLAKVELLTRLERRFRIRLSEKNLAEAESLRDLLEALVAAQPLPEHLATVPAEPAITVQPPTPAANAATLLDVLAWHDRASPDHPHITLCHEDGTQEQLSFHGLSQGAAAVAAGLRRHGLLPGQAVALMLPTCLDYFFSFFGVLLAGGVPVPLYPPARPSQIEEHLRRHRGILDNALTAMIITDQQTRPLARLLKGQVETLRSAFTAAELRAAGPLLSRHGARPEETAFLQYTSGSTGSPKGVVLSHANLLANIRAMGKAVEASAADVFVSWLPLYHDMGLIGAWLGSLYYGCRLVIMSPLAFLLHPAKWLWAIHHHRGTLSASPNFGFELCLNKIDERDLEGLDLSSWRLACNGAEPVSPLTISRFCERFSRHGFRSQAMAPVYGLAEASVGLAFPPLGRAPLIDCVEREPFVAEGRALPAADTAEKKAPPLCFVSCGKPLAGHAIRIADDFDIELPERTEGRVQFMGPSATSGYFRNPEENARLFHGPWLDSGDLGYLAADDLYITSRRKDIIIRGGRNIYPHELEEAIGEIAGIRKGCVAVFGHSDRLSGTERLVVIAETREREHDALQELRRQVNSRATALIDQPPDEVLLMPPHTILKTSSGKLRRAATRELYTKGLLDRKESAVWWQLAKLGLAGLLPSLRRGIRRLPELLYAAYGWSLFSILALPVWLLVVLLPKRRWRWLITRTAARLLVCLSGTRFTINAPAALPSDQPLVLVANHMSYLDAIVVTAALPLRVNYTAKRELRQRLLSRWFLARLDVEFVERFDLEQGAIDTRRIAEKGASGASLFFFAEGTFQRPPGLLPFHMGAFVVAAQAGLPVVPVTILGTRRLLPADSWFPRRGRVTVTIGQPIMPKGREWTDAVALRDAIRQKILTDCGEPDLAESNPPIPANPTP